MLSICIFQLPLPNDPGLNLAKEAPRSSLERGGTSWKVVLKGTNQVLDLTLKKLFGITVSHVSTSLPIPASCWCTSWEAVTGGSYTWVPAIYNQGKSDFAPEWSSGWELSASSYKEAIFKGKDLLISTRSLLFVFHLTVLKVDLMAGVTKTI